MCWLYMADLHQFEILFAPDCSEANAILLLFVVSWECVCACVLGGGEVLVVSGNGHPLNGYFPII